MAKLLNRLWSGADFWQQEENRKQREQFAAPPKPDLSGAKYGVFANPKSQRDLNRGEDFEQVAQNEAIRRTQELARVGQINKDVAATRINAQVASDNVQPNMATNVVKPTSAVQMPGQRVIEAVTNRKVAPVLMGIGRSGAGTAEGISGLYDLATPGEGQNRFGKMATQAGATADNVVEREAYNKLAYKGGQAFGDVATFVAGGAPLTRIATKGTGLVAKAPGLGKAITSIDEAANAGNLVAKGARYLGRPDVIADMATDTLLSAGLRSNRGQAVTPTTILTDAALSLGMGGALGVTGYGVKQGVRGIRNAAPKIADAGRAIARAEDRALTPRVNLDDQIILKDFSDKVAGANPASGQELSDLITQVRIVGDKYGVDLTTGTRSELLDKTNAILDQIGMKNKEISEGGYVRLPGTASDDLVKKVFTKGTDDNSLYHGTKYDNALKILESGRISASKPNANRNLIPANGNGQVSLSRQRNSGFYNSPSADVKFVVDDSKIGKTKGYVDGDLKPSDYNNPSYFEAESQSKRDVPLDAIRRIEGGPLLSPDDEQRLRKLAEAKGVTFVGYNDTKAMRDVVAKPNLPGASESSKLPAQSQPQTPRTKSVLSESSSSAPTIPQPQPVIAPPSPPTPRVQTQPDVPMQPPRGPVTATAGEMAPTNAGAVATKQPGKKTRYADQTVKNSEYVSDATKQNLDSPEYTPNTEKQAYAESGRKYQEVGEERFFIDSEEALNKPNGTISRQDAVDAQTTAQLLDAAGDDLSRRRAADIYDKLSEHFTAAGQTVQAAAIMARRSPESLMYHAINTLKKAGIEIDDGLRTQLQTQIAKIKTMKPGPQREYEINRLMKKVDDNIPSDLADKISSTWKAGLLTGVKTQTGNFLSNGTFGVLHDVSNPGAAFIDKGISLVTGKRTKALTGRGRAGGIVEGTKKGAKFVQTGVDERLATVGKYEGGGVNFKSKFLNTYVNGVFKIMGAADRPAYYSQLRNSLYDIGLAQAKNKRLKGEAKAAFLKDFVDNPPDKQAQIAVNEANKATLNYDTMLSKAMGGVGQAISRIKPESRIGKFALKMGVALNAPFVRVPSAFLSRTIDFTGLGVPKEVLTQISKGQFDQRALSTAISEAATGTALLATGVALAKADLLTGSYPSEAKERERWKAQGIQANSVKMGDSYVSLNYLGPIGIIFGAASRYNDAAVKGEAAGGQVTAAVSGIPKSLTEQSFLQGLNKAISAVSDPAQEGGNYIKGMAGSIVPTLSNDVAVALDSKQRQVDDYKDAIKSRIPGVRNVTLKPAQDVYGNELARKTSAAGSLANPLRPSDRVTNDVKSEVERLHNADKNNKDLQVTPTTQDKTFKSGDATVKLDNKQRYDLQKQVGQATQKAWSTIIKTPEYASLDDEGKANMLTRLRQDVTKVEQRKYAADKQLGQYASDYSGKEKEMTEKEQRLARGEYIAADYTSKQPSTKTSAKKKEGATKVAKKSTGRKSAGGKAKKIPTDLLAKALTQPNIGRAKQFTTKTASAKIPSFKVSTPRVAKRKSQTKLVSKKQNIA